MRSKALEKFWIECQKTQTIVITAIDPTKDKHIIIKQWKPSIKTGNRLKSRENASDQVGIGVSFCIDWLTWRCEFSGPITEIKQNQSNLGSLLILWKLLYLCNPGFLSALSGKVLIFCIFSIFKVFYLMPFSHQLKRVTFVCFWIF